MAFSASRGRVIVNSCAAEIAAVGGNAAGVGNDDLLDGGQTEAEAALPLRKERLENVRQRSDGDARSVIGDGDAHIACGGMTADTRTWPPRGTCCNAFCNTLRNTWVICSGSQLDAR